MDMAVQVMEWLFLGWLLIGSVATVCLCWHGNRPEVRKQAERLKAARFN